MTTMETHVGGAEHQISDAGESVASAASRLGEWVTTSDHKRIGRLYLGCSGASLVAITAVAALLAAERIDTGSSLVDHGALTQLFALYRFGFTYLVLAPAVVGLALAVVPLQVGAKALALPRVAAAGFWAWLLGAGLAVYSILRNGGPGGGNARFVDLFTLSMVLVAVGLLAGLGSLLVTVLVHRAPGMNMRRVPLFSWSVLVAGACLMIAVPVLVGDLLYVFVAHKYPSLSELSGNRALAQWAGLGFTQPATLLWALPVVGVAADVIVTATGRRLAHRAQLFAAVGLAGTAMFALVVQTDVGIPAAFRNLSGVAKANAIVSTVLLHGLPLLGIAGAVLLVLSLLRFKPTVSAPLLFAVPAILLLLCSATDNLLFHVGDAGLAGTTFEEGTWLFAVYAVVLGAMAGVAYWGPKLWGRSMPPKATAPLALVALGGAMLAALPMQIAGFANQPGAVFPTIEAGADAEVNFDYSGPARLWNTLSMVGHVLVLVAVLAFVALAIRSFTRGDAAGDDPWNGQTLEWATSSPAPADNFAEVHIVKSPEHLLDLKPNRSVR